MEKLIRGLFLLAVCAIVSCSGAKTMDGGIEGSAVLCDVAAGKRMVLGKNRDFFVYVEKGKTEEISYVSYSVEMRGSGDTGENGKETTIIRIVKK